MGNWLLEKLNQYILQLATYENDHCHLNSCLDSLYFSTSQTRSHYLPRDQICFESCLHQPMNLGMTPNFWSFDLSDSMWKTIAPHMYTIIYNKTSFSFTLMSRISQHVNDHCHLFWLFIFLCIYLLQKKSHHHDFFPGMYCNEKSGYL